MTIKISLHNGRKAEWTAADPVRACNNLLSADYVSAEDLLRECAENYDPDTDGKIDEYVTTCLDYQGIKPGTNYWRVMLESGEPVFVETADEKLDWETIAKLYLAQYPDAHWVDVEDDDGNVIATA